MNPETKTCQNCKTDFIIEPDDFAFYDKIKVPPPTFCPQCRAQRRMSFRNERKLFKVKNAISGIDIFSLFPQDSNYMVISADQWWGDSWDAMDSGRDFDFSRDFFTQLFELDKEIPVLNLNVSQMVRSEYCANAVELKDCYLIFASQFSEQGLYGTGVNYSRDCVNNTLIEKAERCYECFWLQNCYQCYFTINSVDSRNLWFSRDCLGCNDCFGCVNLRKKSYCIFNVQYTKEQYKIEIEKMKLNTISGIEDAREKARKFWQTQITKYNQGLKNVSSTGSYVTNCKNVKDSFLIRDSEYMKYCQNLEIPGNKDCMDVFEWGEKVELCYETAGSGTNAYNVKFSWDCWPSVSNCQYSLHLRSCSDCFGCVGLKKKQYCILNKQYTKEEYEVLVPKIIEHMNEMPYIDKKENVYKYGEFFPIELSPFGYNNTVASDYLFIEKNDAIQQGYPWFEVPYGNYNITKNFLNLPNSIINTGNEILQDIIECKKCKKAYKILEYELLFLKRENLPLPILCSECRQLCRLEDKLKISLYERPCMCNGTSDASGVYKNTVLHQHGNLPCDVNFKTGYSPDRPEIVYCEKCYQQEVI